MGQALHGALLALLAGGDKGQLLRPQGHPGDLHGLLPHQERRVVRLEERIVHAVSPGVVRRSLLNVAEQGAGLQHPAEIAVAVLYDGLLGVLVQFHKKPF